MDTYIIIEHEVGKPFDPPDPDAQVVKSCGVVERTRFVTTRASPEGLIKERINVRCVLVLWAYPRRS